MKEGAYRLALFTGGWLSLGIGVIGIVVPLLPTTVFVLIAAYCFARSSDRFHAWLLGHRYFGTIVGNFQAGRGLPRAARSRGVVLVWVSLGVSMLLIGAWWGVFLLTTIGVMLTVYLYRLPTYD